MTLSESQKLAVDFEGKNLLVSAAAGSGKTAVLTERILELLMGRPDETGRPRREPARLDRFLIVTFTNAAAAQMREKIAAKIDQVLEQETLTGSMRAHLEQQAVLVHYAQISTIHSFCMRVIRENFTLIDLDPSFRIGDEIQMKLMAADCMERVLEQAYAEEKETSDGFYDFVECFCTGKHDHKLAEMLLKVYRAAYASPFAAEWLEQLTKEQPVGEMVGALLEQTAEKLRAYLEILQQAEKLCDTEGGPQAYRAALYSDSEQVTNLLSLLENASRETPVKERYEKLASRLSDLSFQTLGRVRKQDAVDEEKKENVKKLREEVKTGLGKLKKNEFSRSYEQIEEEEQFQSRMLLQMKKLVLAFMEEFQKEKQEQRLLDFNDLEHLALQILTRKVEQDGSLRLEPSEAALEYRDHFQEIMIDEYQDSNEIQELILGSVSKDNLFMVGDVKQSIYKFRMAKPELFEKKHQSYQKVMPGEDITTKQDGLVELSNNYRSRDGVLDSINRIFEGVMEKGVGNVDYDAAARLYYHGRSFPEYPDRAAVRTECLIGACEPQDDPREVEALLVAKRIKAMLQKPELIYDEAAGEFRPIRKKDIVILFRAMSGWSETFLKILTQEGIEACSDTQTGFFQTDEVKTMLELLKVLDNPRQDIALTAVMLSPIFGFSEEELAAIRENCRDTGWYHACREYLNSGKNERLLEKLANMQERLNGWRKKKQELTLSELISFLLEDSGYLDQMTVLPGGELRRANLKLLVQKAFAFESTKDAGIFSFLRYIERLIRYEIDFGEADAGKDRMDAVTIMSIHKSKGLEFPVVFVAGMKKGFNRMDQNAALLVHAEYGVAMDRMDHHRRLRKRTLRKELLQGKMDLEMKGEEIRILYVALTRAKERLLFTGCTEALETDREHWQNLSARLEPLTEEACTRWVLGRYARAQAGSYLDYVMPVLYFLERKEKEEFDRLFQVNFLPRVQLLEKEMADQQKKKGKHQSLSEMLNTGRTLTEAERKEIEPYFHYVYPYDDLADKKGKVSVSELKKEAYERAVREYRRKEELAEQEGAGELFSSTEEYDDSTELPVPAFRRQEPKVTATGLGTLYHYVLEKLDYQTVEPTAESVRQFLEQLTEAGLLQEAEKTKLSANKLCRFIASGLGKRMKAAAAAGVLYREKPFVMGKPACEVYADTKSTEVILVQGIMDAYFEEGGELVLVDYKTDRVKTPKELTGRYQKQMELYREALERATQKKVKQVLLYSLHLGKEVEVFV